MAVSVGGVSCGFVHNLDDTQTARQRVNVYALPGYPGLGATIYGASVTSYRFEAVLFDSLAAVNTWQGQLEALQGTIGTVIDDDGDTYANLFLWRSRARRKKAVIVPGSPLITKRGAVLIEAVKLNN